MAGIPVVDISDVEAEKVILSQENHFSDIKSKQISPARLTKTISAFSNAEGGEIYIGIDETEASRTWNGFADVEDANGHIQGFESFFPLGDGYSYIFLRHKGFSGIVLKVDVEKSRDIKKASDKVVYVRRGAQNLPITGAADLERLRRSKGIASFETETVAADPEAITNSTQVIEFMLEVVPTAEPEAWLRKQMLIRDEKPTVAGIVLFADEPQAILPKHCGIKLYRYNSSEEEGTREALAGDPISIEGSAYSQIFEAVAEATKIIESVRIMTPEGLKPATYPREALHEVIANAVLHRDYSIADDIHVRIFDNRVEVQSPGTLPAHITPENILRERFARNPTIVRLINKFKNPPNKDVGEGLNTTFTAMRKMNLKDPVIVQTGENVLVKLRHESLGTPQELILKYLESHEVIANRNVREIAYVASENAAKHILQKMVEARELEVIPGKTVFDTTYKLPGKHAA